MAIQAHTIKPAAGAKKTSKRVGRGNASQKGTTAARGMKGQRARSGGRSGLARLGFKTSLQKIPKLRGFRSMYAKPTTLTLAQLQQVAEAGETLTPEILLKKRIIRSTDAGVKVVVRGELTKAITLKGFLVTKQAALAIEKAGGKIVF